MIGKIHWQVIDKNRRDLLGKLSFLNEKGFYMAGGTALAMQIGHRKSVDFDFYCQKPFGAELVVRGLKKIDSGLEAEIPDEGTVLGTVGGVRVSFFEYPYSMIGEFVDATGVNLASVEDIAAMKCIAIVQRGTKRDFVDMYFLEKMFGLQKIFDWTKQKYPMYDVYHIKTALIYYEEAEKDPMPRMLVDCSWEEVKSGLERVVLRG